MTDAARSRDEFETALRDIGQSRYHDLHPFHHLLHGGELDHSQAQAWALNRFFLPDQHPAQGPYADVAY